MAVLSRHGRNAFFQKGFSDGRQRVPRAQSYSNTFAPAQGCCEAAKQKPSPPKHVGGHPDGRWWKSRGLQWWDLTCQPSSDGGMAELVATAAAQHQGKLSCRQWKNSIYNISKDVIWKIGCTVINQKHTSNLWLLLIISSPKTLIIQYPIIVLLLACCFGYCFLTMFCHVFFF